jgi:MFS family permease
LVGLLFQPGSVASLIAFGSFTAISFPLYSLAIALMNDVIDHDLRVPASGVLIMAYGIGSVIGPLAAGFAFDAFGANAFWVMLSLSTGVVVPYAAYRLVRSPRITQHTPYQAYASEPYSVPATFGEDD